MDHKKYTEANRKAWDLVTPRHQKAKAGKFFQAFKQPGYSCLDQIVTAKIQAIGLKGKRVIQIACNDGRETLSLKNLGAESAVGVDISAEAISEARKLSAESGVAAEFLCSDIYELDTEAVPPCDLCYVSIGCFGWMPDLQQFFAIISQLLRPGADILIYEQHPFVELFEPREDLTDLRLHSSYFYDEPLSDEEGLDYWGNTTYQGTLNYWFVHKLSDIFMALINNGFQIIEFSEYPHDISTVFAALERQSLKLPLSMMIHAQKGPL